MNYYQKNPKLFLFPEHRMFILCLTYVWSLHKQYLGIECWYLEIKLKSFLSRKKYLRHKWKSLALQENDTA